MGAPRKPVPSERTCRECGEMHPLTEEFFPRAPSCVGGLDPLCRPCRRIAKRMSRERSPAVVAANRRARRRMLRPLRENEICPECNNLTHRVDGVACWRCDLPFAPEPPLDLRDYLFRTPDREPI
jgi:hypothetical protein